MEVTELSGYEYIRFPEDRESRELFGVKKGDRWGYIDRKGQVVIPFEYDYVSPVSYNECSVLKAGKVGKLTVDNKVIFPTEYISSMRIKEQNPQHYWVQKADSLWYHLYRSDGHLAPTGYRDVWNFTDGIAFVIPTNMPVIEDTPVNRAQLCEPFASTKKLSGKKNVSQAGKYFGYLIDTNCNLLLGWCRENALRKIDLRYYG